MVPSLTIRIEGNMLAAYANPGDKEFLLFTMTPEQARKLAKALKQKAVQIEGYWWEIF